LGETRPHPALARTTGRLLAVDLFAGAGGMTLGLERAGFDVVAAVEIDALACKTYRANHPDVRLWEQDIRKLAAADILEELELEPGDLSLVAGCPPCQGFSSLTTLNGKREVDDPRNDLVAEYGRFVRELKPRAVMMENVPGLAADPRMDDLCRVLEELGYPVRLGLKVLNAVNYGVPQRRRRLVMLALEGEVVPFAAALEQQLTVKDVIGDLPKAGSSGDVLHDVPESRSAEVKKRIAAIRRSA
jgi:DNA (cytosine-5)-methyltransferase 1